MAQRCLNDAVLRMRLHLLFKAVIHLLVYTYAGRFCTGMSFTCMHVHETLRFRICWHCDHLPAERAAASINYHGEIVVRADWVRRSLWMRTRGALLPYICIALLSLHATQKG